MIKAIIRIYESDEAIWRRYIWAVRLMPIALFTISAIFFNFMEFEYWLFISIIVVIMNLFLFGFVSYYMIGTYLPKKFSVDYFDKPEFSDAVTVKKFGKKINNSNIESDYEEAIDVGVQVLTRLQILLSASCYTLLFIFLWFVIPFIPVAYVILEYYPANK